MSKANSKSARMPLVPALEVLAAARTNQVVVTSMGAAREWPKLSQHPLDFHFLPSAMGQGPALALGLALARPDREVWCLNGDGALLMNLGCLVTIGASGATNLTLVLLDNGVYEVTGGQKTAASAGQVDFLALAQGAGISSAAAFDDLTAWKAQAAATLALPGPRFVTLAVEPVRSGYELTIPGPMTQRIARFREALSGGVV
jgi:sulfopyruvate decarboxylase subunit beta